MDGVPTGAPEHCPGTQSENAGKVSACAGCPNQNLCSSGEAKKVDPGIELVKARMASVKNKIFILSGKGGVGKSTFTNLLARSLAKRDLEKKVAVLDIDICGPSQPRMMGAAGEQIHQSGSGWCPLYIEENLSLMSIGFLLSSSEDAVIWRGPKKNTMIRQFLSEVDWDDPLDYLILDTPPGTSDEHLSAVSYLSSTGSPGVSILVTTPAEVSVADVRREITFCNRVGLNPLGVVENMAAFSCPRCKVTSEIFPKDTGGGEKMSKDMGLKFLGSVPIDPLLARACDEGSDVLEQCKDSPAIHAINKIVDEILLQIGE